jgi:hypothetical protein
MITVYVEIEETSSKQVARCLKEYDNIWHALYEFSDGNYGCDCNRAVFFAAVLGLPVNYYVPCGEGKYLVRLLDKTGTVMFGEF